MAAVSKKAAKLAFSSLMSAAAVALMLVARLVSVADYCITAACGLIIGVVVVECGWKWAIASFSVVSCLGLMLGSFECALLFACFFGYYPIVKPYIEKLKIWLEWLLKLTLFNSVIVSLYVIFDKLVAPISDIPYISDTVYFIILIAMANFVFILYDVLFNKLMGMFFRRVHPMLTKYLK